MLAALKGTTLTFSHSYLDGSQWLFITNNTK